MPINHKHHNSHRWLLIALVWLGLLHMQALYACTSMPDMPAAPECCCDVPADACGHESGCDHDGGSAASCCKITLVPSQEPNDAFLFSLSRDLPCPGPAPDSPLLLAPISACARGAPLSEHRPLKNHTYLITARLRL